MTWDDCRWAVLSALEKYWDERLPNRDGLYTEFYTTIDPVLVNLFEKIYEKQTEHLKGVGK